MVVVAPPLGFVDYWNGVIMGERVCVMMIFFSKKTHTQLGTDDASLITNGRLCPLRFKVHRGDCDTFICRIDRDVTLGCLHMSERTLLSLQHPENY
jgi:hypothetical protein